MIETALKTLVEYCTRWPWAVLAVSVVLAAGSTVYSVNHFAINTDISQLISPDLPWRQREIAFQQAFPQNSNIILAVIDAPTSEAASQATTDLVGVLDGRKGLFRSVEAYAESPFFERAALLYLPTQQVRTVTGQLQQAAPLIQVLAKDPSLRGLSRALSFGLMSTEGSTLAPMTGLLNRASDTVEKVLDGQPAFFSWREMITGEKAETSATRRFVEIHPVLDYAALQPGQKATDAIRSAADKLKLKERFGATVRLTGSVPIADEEYSSLQEGAVPNLIATMAIVLVILWLALRSARIILAVFLTVAVGLAVTAAVGLMMVGALNLISVAFAVLFVGIGVDFGIQFSVRYRAERHAENDLRTALVKAGEHIATPLSLAAAATAAGFLSFVPTAYRGVSELGQIAGVGMIIAFVGSITLLPALLTLLNPPGEREPLGYAALAPVDRFMERHRWPILIGTVAMVVAALPALYFLRFDFNPIHLRNPAAESIATYLDVRADPAVGANAIDIVADSPADARRSAERLRKLPEVSSVRSLANFIPADQDAKLTLIRNTAQTLLPALTGDTRPPPSDKENLAALNSAQQALTRASDGHSGAGAQAGNRLAADLRRLADADPATRAAVQSAFITPLQTALHGLRLALQPKKVNEQALPETIKRAWRTDDGRARVEVLPKSDLNSNEEIRDFARAVQAVEPTATGGPIAILESGRTIIRAFFEAGLWALISISVLLWLALRRVTDVLLTMVPLIVAGVVTLELCVAFGLAINFANIIALPLLLGIGVAFKIYYVMGWRAGQSQVLQSPLTRAVFFSALTTATAFGSLWFSSHPGTSSMGKLLALSLVCTLAAAVLFQPVLMGPPRTAAAAGKKRGKTEKRKAPVRRERAAVS
jgi:hopanoid biosynthesis associated RND transporter like protein HpnN